MSSRSTLETGPFETTFALALDCEHFVSILMILLVLVRVTLLFFCFAFRDVRTQLRHIHWDLSCGLCGSGSVRVCAHTDGTHLPRMQQLAASPAATCSSEKGRYCGCQSTASRISFGIMCHTDHSYVTCIVSCVAIVPCNIQVFARIPQITRMRLLLCSDANRSYDCFQNNSSTATRHPNRVPHIY